jgi:Leucine-rich repeat (LRR) protein/nicotinamide mononucleotide adenylyltransferase
MAERIIGTLGSAAVRQIRLLWGVEDELRSLRNTVSTIQAVLLDAEDQRAAGNHAVTDWQGKLEDVFSDVNDLLDAISTEALRREAMTRDKKAKQVRIFFSKSNQLASGLRIANRIKAITERLDAINAERRGFHLEVGNREREVGIRERDNTHSFVRAETVIGREDDKKAVIHRLLDSNVEENVSILPIVGFGGLGKTTLAQLIFNEEIIKYHFQLRMWVCVSDPFHVKNIVEKILESATKRQPKAVGMDTLVGKLKEEIDGKRFFLVLDDVWNEDHEKWSRLKQVLMGGARGSRILVTTRYESVARTIRQVSVAKIIGALESYSLEGLAGDASWSLFKQKAFEKGQEPENASIVALGREILEKCSGVPLAIKTIGRVLRSKNTETEWLSFKNSELSKMSLEENYILPSLKLSYNQLSSHSEVCRVETRVGNRERDNTHSFVHAEAFIGRDDDKKVVIHRLLDSNVEENVSILPIVGIGGLGKTTLAQLVFNDEQIENHFQLKMWVCVSESFNVENIVEKILESATKEKPETVEWDRLVNYLLKEIDGKKYFLILDDVWNGDHENWCRLKEVLMGGARGSRILVTTRNEIGARAIRQQSVAKIIGTVESYSLKGLAEDASWSLFKQKAFQKGQEPDNSIIIALGKEIVQKCSGVPLAITTIGSLLGSKNPETEWSAFKNNELSKISQNENDILPTLKLSYDHLLAHLKQCFTFCSLFPKDYKIDRSTLIKLWIAQGFVKLSDQNRCLEDVGDEYFMDLLWRPFFEEAEKDEFGSIIQCKMHDLMHDLAISVAGSLITTLDDKSDEKTRHVSFGCDINLSSVVQMCKPSRIRTFICLRDDYLGPKIDCEAIFSSFKFLRVLGMHNSNLDSVPSSIGKLKYLRYLDLSSSYYIKKLPDSITWLQNLQTLRLTKCWSLKELPRDLKKLVNLRHLELDGCKSLEELPGDIKKLINLRHLEIDECYCLTSMPHGLGQLTNLQKLSRFVVHSGHSDSSGLKELNRLNNLRGKLVIENLEHGEGVASESKAANLEGKHLHALHLWWSSRGYVNDSDVSNDEASLEGFQPHSNLKHLRLVKYRGSRLSGWLLSLTKLVRFELFWCKNCQHLPLLSQLPSLKYLVLISLDAIEYISDGGDSNEKKQFFSSLREISLSGCPNLKGWWRNSSVEVNSPYFSRLSTLSISSCPMLTSMPTFPHLEEKLVLDNPSLKLLQQTMMMSMATPQSPMPIATTSSSSTYLSKLKSIQLISIVDLETLPLQNLTSLESLMISGCHRLKSLFPGIQHLTALQCLHVEDCLELELANDEGVMQWQGLPSLLSLCFSRLPKLVSLPLRLQHATTLQKLKVSHCLSLTAIPKWIHNCKSLQVLEIRRCLSLPSLPQEMRRLMSLQRLTIVDCPVLFQRCKRETGEDWAKIAHIPKLDLQ